MRWSERFAYPAAVHKCGRDGFMVIRDDFRDSQDAFTLEINREFRHITEV